jgi:hypothetical protein
VIRSLGDVAALNDETTQGTVSIAAPRLSNWRLDILFMMHDPLWQSYVLTPRAKRGGARTIF